MIYITILYLGYASIWYYTSTTTMYCFDIIVLAAVLFVYCYSCVYYIIHYTAPLSISLSLSIYIYILVYLIIDLFIIAIIYIHNRDNLYS